MFRRLAAVLFIAGTLVAQTPKKGDDVPDEKTAVRIAEAVLVAKYGEDAVKAKLPLHADGSNPIYWIVEGYGPGPATSKGGGPVVWINRHTGCLRIMEHTK